MNDISAAAIKERVNYGQLEEDELTVLAEGLLSFPWGPENIIVEIGTYKGRTPIMMAKVLATIGQFPSIVSIDAFDRVIPTGLNCRGSYAIAIENILACGLAEQCILISAFSNNAAPIIPDRIAALIIDGWHSFEQATNDLENYIPKLSPGGFALVDDYCDFYPGVVQAIDEYLIRHPEIILKTKLNKGVILQCK